MHMLNRTHTVLPPEGVSVSEVQPHSVRVSWQAVEGADTYTVTFTQTMGNEQQGLCTDSHSVSTEDPSLSVVVGEDEMLRAFTTYSITQSSECSTEHCPVQTLSHSVQSEMWNMPVEVSLTGLTPFINYSIQAAPVNILSQVGSYSDIAVTLTEDSETTIIIVITWNKIIISTSFSPAPGPVDVTLFPSFFKIIITWGHPTIPNGIITGYEVIYWPVASPETATTVNTDLETTYTLSGLDVGMEFSFIVRAFTQLGPGQPVTVTVSTLSRPCKDNKFYMLSVNKYLSFNFFLPFTNSCSRGCGGY